MRVHPIGDKYATLFEALNEQVVEIAVYAYDRSDVSPAHAADLIETTCSSPIASVECRDETSPSVNYTCDNYTFDHMCECQELVASGDRAPSYYFNDEGYYVVPSSVSCDDLDIIAYALFGLSLSSAYLDAYVSGGQWLIGLIDNPLDNADTDTDVCYMRSNLELPEKYERLLDY